MLYLLKSGPVPFILDTQLCPHGCCSPSEERGRTSGSCQASLIHSTACPGQTLSQALGWALCRERSERPDLATKGPLAIGQRGSPWRLRKLSLGLGLSKSLAVEGTCGFEE